MWSGGSVRAWRVWAWKVAATAVRSDPTPASDSGTGPIVSTCLRPGHLSSSSSARASKYGSMMSVVMPASLIT